MNAAEKAGLLVVGILIVVALLNFGDLIIGGGPAGSKIYLSYNRTGG